MERDKKLLLGYLRQKQSLPLEGKIQLAKQRIREFNMKLNNQTYIAFSGGKDSTVLLHLVRQEFPNTPAVFVDTGLEYPEIRDFVRTIDNVIWINPSMNFKKVIETYGYPVISKTIARQIYELKNPTEKNAATRKLYYEGIKRDGTKTKSFKLPLKWRALINAPFKISEKCCDIMKKKPIYQYMKENNKKGGFIGTMAADSSRREGGYLKTGCNSFKKGNVKSMPLSVWFEKDIWEYIRKYNIPYSKIYDMGEKRTGCIFCMFGIHLEKGLNRFQRMQISHPNLYNYCINKLGLKEVLEYLKINYKYQEQNTFFD